MKHPHSRIAPFRFSWPDPPLHIVLVHPEIPPNTGNVARLCAATGTVLHLVEPLGFSLSDRYLRRAGLDYWDAVPLRVHPDWPACLAALPPPPSRRYFFTTASPRLWTDAAYRPGDVLVFGCETRGLPDSILAANPDGLRGIPMHTESVRSLNLSSSVAIAAYEALRQIDLAARANPQPPPAP